MTMTIEADDVPVRGLRMTPAAAALALRQVSLSEVLGLLAYVEGFALVVGSLGLALAPVRIVRHAAELVTEGRAAWVPHRRTWPAHVRAVLRALLADRLRLEAVARTPAGRPVEDVRMAVAQLGGLAGVAELAQAAGELMVFVRADDPAMLHEAVQVCDDVRARLAQLAAVPGADDTAPIVRMPASGAVSAAIDDSGTSATSAPREIRDAPTPRERRT